jgi:hypothetical protein
MDVIKALAIIVAPVVLLFGVVPVLFWAALNFGLLIGVSFWGAYALWMFIVMFALSIATIRYLFGSDENSPKPRIIHQLVSGEGKNEHTR